MSLVIVCLLISDGAKAREVALLLRSAGLECTWNPSMIEYCCSKGIAVVDEWYLKLLGPTCSGNIVMYKDPLLLGLEIIKLVDGELREVLVGIDPGSEVHTIAVLANGRPLLVEKASTSSIAVLASRVVRAARALAARSIRIRVGLTPPAMKLLEALQDYIEVVELVPEDKSSKLKPLIAFDTRKLGSDERAALNIALRRGLRVGRTHRKGLF